RLPELRSTAGNMSEAWIRILSSDSFSRLQPRQSRRPLMKLHGAFLALAALSAGANAQQSWEQLPMMELQGIYRGPMRDTLIQRWRDPETGAICYIYLPIIAQNAPAEGAPYVQYGSNQIGTISCVPGPATTPPAAPDMK